jgi:UDP-3-O-[3-hydroxymyristoyl] glucosamine N-acyltransferase
MNLGSLTNFDSSFTVIKGDISIPVFGITDLSEIAQKHCLFIKNKKFYNNYLEKKNNDKNIGLVFERNYFEIITDDEKKGILDSSYFVATVDDVNLAMSYISKPFYDQSLSKVNDMVDGRQMGTSQVDPSAFIAQGVFIGENVRIAQNVKIHSGVVIMSGVEVKANVEIYPNTVVYRNVKIGKNTRIHANCTIGTDGFGYNFKNGEHLKVWHMGSVVIGENVEIGSNCSIDSGTFSPTIIGNGTKLDNQVHIAHNCRLGTGVLLCGQVGVAGSVVIEDYVAAGGGACIAPGVTVGKAAQIAGLSGVSNNILAGESVGGFPARNIKEWLKGVAFVRKLSLNKEKKLE